MGGGEKRSFRISPSPRICLPDIVANPIHFRNIFNYQLKFLVKYTIESKLHEIYKLESK